MADYILRPQMNHDAMLTLEAILWHKYISQRGCLSAQLLGVWGGGGDCIYKTVCQPTIINLKIKKQTNKKTLIKFMMCWMIIHYYGLSLELFFWMYTFILYIYCVYICHYIIKGSLGLRPEEPQIKDQTNRAINGFLILMLWKVQQLPCQDQKSRDSFWFGNWQKVY